jgi:hypothetical protein
LRALRDTLNRQTYDLQQHYEALMASDALASLAGSGAPPREDRGQYPGKLNLKPKPSFNADL